jgi:DNA-binding NarL/FixJ family response regulator
MDHEMPRLPVILVDHCSELHDLLESFLRTYEINVVGRFTNADRVLDRVVRLAPDLAMVDLWLAELSGYKLIGLLKPLNPTTKVIATSAEFRTERAVLTERVRLL